LRIGGELLLSLKDSELSELGLLTELQRHKFKYELEHSKNSNSDSTARFLRSGGGRHNQNNRRLLSVRTLGGNSLAQDTTADTLRKATDSTTTGGANEGSANPTTEKPRFVRKWTLRQAFVKAVEDLPDLSEEVFKKICPKELNLGADTHNGIVSTYLRFLRTWYVFFSLFLPISHVTTTITTTQGNTLLVISYVWRSSYSDNDGSKKGNSIRERGLIKC
jgi:hypothetical protein